MSSKNRTTKQATTGPKRAAIYCRVSRAYKEDDERVTIEAQLAECEGYCNERGYVIVARYVDKDKYKARGKLVNPSGTRKDRPGYVAMLKAAEAEEFDMIVAWKEDRLYRGMYAAIPLVEVLDERKKGQNALTVELVKESFDRSMLEIKAAIAKKEIDNIRDRMVMGRRVRLERGEVPGGELRYGYAKEDKKLTVNEAEAMVVRHIFEWYNGGENNMEMRRRLNFANVSPRKGKLWSKMTIQNITTFEGYATGEYTVALDGEKYIIPCPPIISMETWHKAQETRAGNKKYRGRNVKEDYLCRGMVVCLCGWKWHALTCYGNRQTGKCGYYACAKHAAQPELVHLDCPGSIGAKKLDTFVWQFVLTVCNHPEVVQQAIDKKIEQLKAEQDNLEADADRLQRELDKITEERQWAITQARKGKITEDDMEMQLVALDFQALALRKEREDKLTALAIQRDTEYVKEWASQYLTDIGAGLKVLDTDPVSLSEVERESIFAELEASRFLEKFNCDRLAALRWAILEEKRRTVRTLITKVLVVKGENGEKLIVPQLALEVPREFISLVYSHQSLEYIESFKDSPFVVASA